MLLLFNGNAINSVDLHKQLGLILDKKTFFWKSYQWKDGISYTNYSPGNVINPN